MIVRYVVGSHWFAADGVGFNWKWPVHWRSYVDKSFTGAGMYGDDLLEGMGGRGCATFSGVLRARFFVFSFYAYCSRTGVGHFWHPVTLDTAVVGTWYGLCYGSCCAFVGARRRLSLALIPVHTGYMYLR